MTISTSRCFIQDNNINITDKKAKKKRLEVSQYFGKPLKKNGTCSSEISGNLKSLWSWLFCYLCWKKKALTAVDTPIHSKTEMS